MKYCVLLVLQVLNFWPDINAQNSVRVGFQIDGVPRKESLMEFRKNFNGGFYQFSVCFRITILQLRHFIPILSYATISNENEILIGLNPHTEKLVLSCSNPAAVFHFNHSIIINKLESICLIINPRSNSYATAFNGYVTNVNFTEEGENKRNISIKGGGIVRLGQQQDKLENEISKLNSLSGYLIDFAFYNRSLTVDEIVSYTGCEQDLMISKNGLVFDFSNIKEDFTISNVTLEYFTPKQVLKLMCNTNISYLILFAGEKNFKDSQFLCHSLGGQLVAPKNAEENNALYKFINKYKEKCSFGSDSDFSWLGVTANETGRHYQHYLTGNKMGYFNLRRDKKPNWATQHCVTMFANENDKVHWHGAWNPKECVSSSCVACYFQEHKFLSLRGLCHKSLFDRKYTITSENKTEYFKGNFYSFIKLDENIDGYINERNYWKIFRYDRPNVYAKLSVDSAYHFPIGRNNWSISGDICTEQESIVLILTICREDEFTCNDGSCIDLFKRCDSQVDCVDASDEVDCYKLILPPNYSYLRPPPKPSVNENLILFFYLDIHSIHTFDLTGFNFKAEVTLMLRWKDCRLSYSNLKQSEDMNGIELKSEIKIWTPQYTFIGDQNSSSEVNTLSELVYVRRDSEPLQDDDSYVSNDERFDGCSNDLALYHKMLLWTSCQFDLLQFPFDTQTCSIFVLLHHGSQEYVRFLPKDSGISFSGKRRLLQYSVLKWTYNKATCGKIECAEIELKFDNISWYYVTNTYIPTLVMLIIGFLPFLFGFTEFNDRIVVATTSLLVEATFFSQLTVTVPQTAYMKMIDVWFVFCIIVLFIICLVLTYINFLLRKTSTVKEIRIMPYEKRFQSPKWYKNPQFLNQVSTIGFPVITGIFTFAYAMVAVFDPR